MFFAEFSVALASSCRERPPEECSFTQICPENNENHNALSIGSAMMNHHGRRNCVCSALSVILGNPDTSSVALKMKSYLLYSNKLDTLLNEIEWGAKLQLRKQRVIHSLNGGASEELHQIVSNRQIRRNGTFFTGELLGRRAVSRLVKNKLLLQGPVYDPTCGAGDLLLRWAEFLPIESSLVSTLRIWEKLLFGTDLHPEFIQVAKRRLVLQALVRGARLKRSSPPRIEDLFPGLTAGDILKRDQIIPREATLLMNPPFTLIKAPNNCDWASGSVSMAAVSFMKFLDRCSIGQHVIAILPDVLRSGTRYARWRNKVVEKLRISRLDVYGRFDSCTDIDVFIAEGQVDGGRKLKVGWTKGTVAARSAQLKSFCKISVGAVVPHRDPKKGPWKLYVEVANLPAWGIVRKICTHRRFEGSTVEPPFVAVRRTSSPSDPERAIATIVSGKEPVALENHLIALKPKDGKVGTCKLIMRSLKDTRTREWLNKRIRCRHLTVMALRDLPLLDKNS